jgi:hypothetical protein
MLDIEDALVIQHKEKVAQELQVDIDAIYALLSKPLPSANYRRILIQELGDLEHDYKVAREEALWL